MGIVERYWHGQIVHVGIRIIRIGFNRDIKKFIEGLHKETYETIVLDDVAVLSSTATMGLAEVKKLIIQNAGAH